VPQIVRQGSEVRPGGHQAMPKAAAGSVPGWSVPGLRQGREQIQPAVAMRLGLHIRIAAERLLRAHC